MDIRADRQDRAVNKPLGTERAGVLHDRIAVQREFEDIVGLYKGRAQGARQQESARIAGMTQAESNTPCLTRIRFATASSFLARCSEVMIARPFFTSGLLL